jgi:hypothetical protein
MHLFEGVEDPADAGFVSWRSATLAESRNAGKGPDYYKQGSAEYEHGEATDIHR